MPMRITKVITVEVCSTCGHESPHQAFCFKCRKELCQRCSEMVHIHAQRYTPKDYGSSIHLTHQLRNGTLCTECASKLIGLLCEYGMVASKEPPCATK